MEAVERAIGQSILGSSGEKTFIDKLLGKNDVDRVRELVRKEKLTREELLELLYSLSGTEMKLLNMGSWDRYVILKYFVWIRDFVKNIEIMYDYQEKISSSKQGLLIDKKRQERLNKLIAENEKLAEHMIKFMVDLYFNMARTTLSLNATGFMELLKNKYEVLYPNQNINPSQEKKSWWRM
jgi:hypothetical protein